MLLHLWRCGTRQRGETSHPGGWKSPRTPSGDDAAISCADWPEPSSAQPRKVRSHDVQVRPGSFVPGLATALFSAAGDEAACTRREGGSALSEVCRPVGSGRGISTVGRRSRGFYRLPEGRGCICRTHLPDPGSGRGLRSGVDTQRFNLCGSRALSSSRAIARHRFGQSPTRFATADVSR